MIEIKHLRLLKAIEAGGSLSAAARSLGYSQPAVTQQLQALEREIGTPVLLRGGTGVRLTPAGQLLLAHGKTVIDMLDLAAAEIESLRSMTTGIVRIATFPSAAATIVPEAMRQLRDRHPGMSFTVTEATPVEAMELLGSGRCDVAVTFQYSSEAPLQSELVRTPLMVENVYVAFGPDSPLPNGARCRLSDFSEATWIAGCPKCSGNIVDSCRAAGFDPVIGYETDDYVAVQSLALNGFGVSLIPDLILSIIKLPGLKLGRLEPAQTRQIDVVSSRGLLATPGVSETVVELQHAAATLVERGRPYTGSGTAASA